MDNPFLIRKLSKEAPQKPATPATPQPKFTFKQKHTMVNPLAPENAHRFFRLMISTFFVLIIVYAISYPFFRDGMPAPTPQAPTGLEEQLEKESELLKEYRQRKLERANKAAELTNVETDMLDTRAAIEEQRKAVDSAINEGIPEDLQKPERLVPIKEEVKM